MPKRKFKPTDGLIEDVMTKQDGTLEKAVLEGIMNSTDAGASRINITLTSDRLVIEDDGKGMSEEDVEEFFTHVGKKDEYDEDKTFGRFHMGRGQIFNFGMNVWRTQGNAMVVNLRNDTSTVELPYATEQDDESIKNVDGNELELDTEGLSYAWLELDNDIEGCSVAVDLYNRVDDVEEKVQDIKDIAVFIPWVNDVQISINGEEIVPKGMDEYNIHETDEAYFFTRPSRFGTKTKIYNQGAYVKSESITQTQGTIITKVDLEVNFARNNILLSDDNWDKIVYDYKQFTVNELLDRDRLQKREKKWLLKMATNDEDVYMRIRDIPMFEDVNGEMLSLSQLEGEKVSFAPSGTKQAADAQEETGTLMVDQTYSDDMLALAQDKSASVKEYTDVVEQEMKWEMKEFDYSELNKRRKQNFERISFVLDKVGFDGNVKVGYSQYADCWKQPEGAEMTLFVDKVYLKARKQDFILEKIPQILEVAAQRGDTREGLEHSYGFKDNWWDYTKELGKLQKQLLNGNVEL